MKDFLRMRNEKGPFCLFVGGGEQIKFGHGTLILRLCRGQRAQGKNAVDD